MSLFKFLPLDPDTLPAEGANIGVLSLPLSLDTFAISSDTLIQRGLPGASVVYKGTGFAATFDPMGFDVTAGKITSITVRLEGRLVLTGTGLNLSAESLFNLIEANNFLGVINYIMRGNDRVEGTNLDDSLAGMSGNDTILAGGGADTVLGFAGNDVIYGGSGSDSVTASAGADRVFGGGQGDQLLGEDGSDQLFGGLGADTLSGGAGRDTLTGGSGADQFLFADATGASNVDVITDFQPGTDRIALDNDIFLGLGGAGVLAASAFHQGPAATFIAHRVIYTKSTGTITYDANGDGVGGAIVIARVTPGLTLGASDFLIID